jgi:hypothetical protein
MGELADASRFKSFLILFPIQSRILAKNLVKILITLHAGFPPKYIKQSQQGGGKFT